MKNWAGGFFALVAALGVLLVAAAPARATRIRPGTPSFGATFDYATLGGSTYMAKAFDHGIGGAVQIRYRMRGGWMAGVVFGEQTFQARPAADTLDRMRVVTAGIELGRYFGPHESPVFVIFGAGVWSPTAFPAGSVAADRDQEAYEANKKDLIYLSASVGTEIFFRRTVALNLFAKGMIHRSQELGYPYYNVDRLDAIEASPASFNREFQLGAGLHFYVMD